MTENIRAAIITPDIGKSAGKDDSQYSHNAGIDKNSLCDIFGLPGVDENSPVKRDKSPQNRYKHHDKARNSGKRDQFSIQSATNLYQTAPTGLNEKMKKKAPTPKASRYVNFLSSAILPTSFSRATTTS